MSKLSKTAQKCSSDTLHLVLSVLWVSEPYGPGAREAAETPGRLPGSHSTDGTADAAWALPRYQHAQQHLTLTGGPGVL